MTWVRPSLLGARGAAFVLALLAVASCSGSGQRPAAQSGPGIGGTAASSEPTTGPDAQSLAQQACDDFNAAGTFGNMAPAEAAAAEASSADPGYQPLYDDLRTFASTPSADGPDFAHAQMAVLNDCNAL
jgi:hypothetical protein